MQHRPREWRAAFLALAALVAVLVLPLLLRGEVVHPDDGRAAIGLSPEVEARNLGGRRLGDTSNYYVPETHHHLHGDSSAWLSLWNPHVQLGRPSSHLAGVSPAYPPARILGWFVTDAYWFHTLLALATIAGTAAFLGLFLRAIELSPWACFAGAAGLGLGSFSIYWAPFPIFVAGLCWTAALLWLVARWLQRPSIACGVGLAFATYALLLSAYPQQIVWHAWIVGGFAIGRWWRTPGRRAATIGALALCAVLGAAAAAPVYVDVALQAARSARLEVDGAFFLASLPVLESARDVLRFLGSMVDAFVTSDPYALAREREFNGVSLAPAFAGFVALSLAASARRRAAGWLAFAGLAIVMTIWPGLYLFAVEHLGLSLSRFRPQAAALIPLAVAGAIGVDALLRDRARSPIVPLGLALAPLVFVAFVARDEVPLGRWIALAASGVGLAAFAILRWRALIPALALASLLFWSAPLLVAIPRDAIADDSPLVDMVRARTPGETRFMLAGDRPLHVLQPNQEARLGLASVHSYDSLSPESYRAWCAEVSSVGAQLHGRWFQFVAGSAGYSRPAFSQACVGLVLARERIASDALVADGELGPWVAHRPVRAPVWAAHVLDLAALDSSTGEVTLGGHVQDRETGSLELVESRDDLWRARIEPRSKTTILFLSRQHHASWKAYGNESAPLETVLVDGCFLGVVVPAGCSAVTLRFEPWARWSWIPQALFAGAFAFLFVGAFASRRRSILAS